LKRQHISVDRTVSLCATFGTKGRVVAGKRVARAGFVVFLTDIVVTKPRGKETRQVDGSLDRHTKLQSQVTQSSRPNRIQIRFAKHDVIARGMFMLLNQV
jgi:hypothetical protein